MIQGGAVGLRPIMSGSGIIKAGKKNKKIIRK